MYNDTLFCQKIIYYKTLVFNELNFKYHYSDLDFLSKNSNGIGFYTNNLNFIYFQIPFMVIIYFIFYLTFKALFNYRISKILRYYSLFGTLISLIFEGNI